MMNRKESLLHTSFNTSPFSPGFLIAIARTSSIAASYWCASLSATISDKSSSSSVSSSSSESVSEFNSHPGPCFSGPKAVSFIFVYHPKSLNLRQPKIGPFAPSSLFFFIRPRYNHWFGQTCWDVTVVAVVLTTSKLVMLLPMTIIWLVR